MSLGWPLEHVLVVLLVYHLLRILWSQRPSSAQTQKKKGPPRQWRPKTPRDCPACQEGVKLTLCRVKRQVTPWSQVKSRRGKKKTIPTQGYACPNPDCRYCGITDAAIHARWGTAKATRTMTSNTSGARPATVPSAPDATPHSTI